MSIDTPVQSRRSVPVQEPVLRWARSKNLPAGFSRVPASTYDAYLAAHPHLSHGDHLVQTEIRVVRPPEPQPSRMAQMYASHEQRQTSRSSGSLAAGIAALLGTRRVEEPVAQVQAKPARVRTPRSRVRVYPEGIRPWARQNGFKVSNGSIDPAVIEAFYAAHPDVQRLHPQS